MMPKEQIVDGLTVTLTVVSSRTEAELISGLLRGNGLRAAVSADDAGGQGPQLQLEGVRVALSACDEHLCRSSGLTVTCNSRSLRAVQASC